MPNQTCDQCGTRYHIKKSRLGNMRSLGFFCSHVCLALAKKAAYIGSNNPNYKGRNTDSDGYRLAIPSASRIMGATTAKLHRAVCCEVLGVTSIPLGYHVHHRDCDLNNNIPANLAVLNVSDHKWLHKQYGVAVLWAFTHGKISLEALVSWSDDKCRASRLLPLDVTQQHISHLTQPLEVKPQEVTAHG